MNRLELQYQKIKQLLEYGELNAVVKKVIDFTIDTNDITAYRSTMQLVTAINDDRISKSEASIKLSEALDSLYHTLSKLSITKTDEVIITALKLVKSYSNSPFRLGPITFSLKSGEIIGLVGENGNGKTTLLRALCGELAPTSGLIEYAFPFDNMYDLRSNLIYIPQRTDTWYGGLFENLQFTAACYGIQGEENELLVDLIIARMGLAKYRNYKWKDLSSGYKMRFELARALLRKPKVLLIDEPLANLDILAQQTILEDFRELAQSLFNPLSIVLSSQQLYEVEKASDNVIFLKEGAPQNLKNEESVETEEIASPLIIEFESENGLDSLRSAFEKIKLQQLQVNGGTYIAYFPNDISLNDFLTIIVQHEIALLYFRNISQSTRRFFLS